MTSIEISTRNNRILDIGCGNTKVLGAVGVDFKAYNGVDILHNLNEFPYPFGVEEFDVVYIRNTLFLLEHPLRVMEEVYRILKYSGRVVVVQPYFRSVWNHVDPLTKTYGTAHSFAFYDPEDPICTRYQYTDARFLTEKIIFDEHLVKPNPVRQLLCWLANRHPKGYEVYLSHLFPLDAITYHLIKV